MSGPIQIVVVVGMEQVDKITSTCTCSCPKLFIFIMQYPEKILNEIAIKLLVVFLDIWISGMSPSGRLAGPNTEKVCRRVTSFGMLVRQGLKSTLS